MMSVVINRDFFPHPYLREKVDYLLRPEPSNYSKVFVGQFANYVSNELEFEVGGDLSKVVKSLGGKIRYVDPIDWELTESGSILVHGEQDFDLFISNFTGLRRDRFTIAHELGHYFLHSNQGQIAIVVARYGRDRLEWEADWFAAEFLMPEENVRKLHKEKPGVVELSYIFDVSDEAMHIRLQSLGLS